MIASIACSDKRAAVMITQYIFQACFHFCYLPFGELVFIVIYEIVFDLIAHACLLTKYACCDMLLCVQLINFKFVIDATDRTRRSVHAHICTGTNVCIIDTTKTF